MNYIVLDFEFNQPYNFKDGTPTILNPLCPFEIIQIGAVKLNDNFEITDKFNSFIKPQIYEKMHPIVENLTHITIDDINNSPTFNIVFENFMNFIGNDKSVLCTWGVDDIKNLYKNILYYNIEYSSILDEYINIQSFASKFLKYEAGKSIGLKNAVTMLNLPIDNNFHDAFNDAEYTAEIFKLVKPKELIFTKFSGVNISVKIKKDYKKKIDTKKLILHFKEILNREITNEEISIIKSAYKLGRNKTFDMDKKN